MVAAAGPHKDADDDSSEPMFDIAAGITALKDDVAW